MGKKVECWVLFDCKEEECPVYKLRDPNCWLVSGTHCRNEIQGKFLEKIEMCFECKPFKTNVDVHSLEDTLKVVSRQFGEFRKMVDERDRELEGVSMELALGLSEVFEALKEISSGDPSVRILEDSELELISKLKHMVNLTAQELAEIVNLSHEFAIGLAEHFDALLRVSKGDLSARVSGTSEVELLESLRNVTNHMIESVSREITERSRAEKALRASEAELRESEEKYHTLYDYDPNSIFALESGTLKILDVNARALEVYGHEKPELIGRSFTDLGSTQYGDGVLSSGGEASSARFTVYPKIKQRKKDGTRFYVNVYAAKRKRSQKYGIIATTVDITESLERETQLLQASKMSTLGEMATGVAHELNQPLTTIQLGADFMMDMAKQGREIPEALLSLISEQMTGQVSRAVRIITHLREFGHKGEVRREKVDVNKPIKGVFTLLSQQLKLRGIEVVLDLNDDLPLIMGDSNRLEQVFIDLVMNARDAMEEKKRHVQDKGQENTLTVRSFQKNGWVVVAISDTGLGVPHEIRDKIFEPFFTTKKVGEGTGLGLSISYGIVKDYDGTIEVESEEGKGSTFETSFPVCEE
jgi:PAS domain S-box-containing protein